MRWSGLDCSKMHDPLVDQHAIRLIYLLYQVKMHHLRDRMSGSGRQNPDAGMPGWTLGTV